MKKLIILFFSVVALGCNPNNCKCEADCCASGECVTESCSCTCKK